MFCDQGEPYTLQNWTQMYSEAYNCSATAYWQRAIASRPSTAVRGYIVGGTSWLSYAISLPPDGPFRIA